VNRIIRAYHYSVNTGQGRTTIPKVAHGSLHESLTFFSERSWRASSVGSLYPQTYLSALFSCQRTNRLISLSKPTCCTN